MEIRSIMCCCGQGLGSSMIVSMNVEKALKKLGVSGVKVEHTAIGEVTPVCHRSRPCTSDDELQKQDHLKSAYGYE